MFRQRWEEDACAWAFVKERCERSKHQDPSSRETSNFKIQEIDLPVDRRRRGEDTAPYMVSQIEFIRHGYAGRFGRRSATSPIQQHREAIRRAAWVSCR